MSASLEPRSPEQAEGRVRSFDGSTVSWRSRVLHIFALSGFAVAQPLLGLLGGEPGFWIARGATVADAAMLILMVVIVIPLVVIVTERLVAIVDATAGWVVHVIAVAGFVYLITLNVLDTVTGGDVQGRIVLVLSAVFAVALVGVYLRFAGARDFVSVLAVGPIIFTILFVVSLPPLGGTDAPTVDAGIDSATSVVLVVLDEFPLAPILGEDGSIDRTRFPNFGRLADVSTYYPNATTVHDNSLKAVPAILTGRYVVADEQATAEDHPLSIFTVLGDTHSMVVNESFTQVCPESICEDAPAEDPLSERFSTLMSDSTVIYLHTVIPTRLRYRLPPIGTRWGNFVTTDDSDIATLDQVESDARDAGVYETELAALTGSEERAVDYGVFLDSLDPDLGPTLYYLHVEIPHAPWSFTPAGRPYPFADHILGYTPEGIWKDDPWYIQQAYQRFLFNAGFADALVGRTLDQLEDRAMLDDVLLVFVSDHGENFAVDESRRAFTDDTLAALGGVPLFVKYPGQTTGAVDRRSAQTIDVLPTVVDVLGGSIEGMDGTSLLSDDPPVSKRFVANSGREFTLALGEYEELFDDFFVESRELLPAGVGFEGITGVAGPRPDLNGRSVDAFEVIEVPGKAVINTREFFANYDPDGVYDPIAVPADIEIADGELPTTYAIAVNGVILSTITAYEVSGRTASIYGIVPPGSYRPGPNEVEVFGIVGGESDTVLQRFS